jgi:hypothetical protein
MNVNGYLGNPFQPRASSRGLYVNYCVQC